MVEVSVLNFQARVLAILGLLPFATPYFTIKGCLFSNPLRVHDNYSLIFSKVFKVRSKEDGFLYAVKKSRDKFRGDADR